MKEILLKGVVFCLGGLLILHALAYIARTFSPSGTSLYLQIDRNNVQSVLDNASQIEAVVVGDSHGDDVLVSEMEYTGYQLSRAWGDLFEIHYYLKSLVPRMPNLEIVYIPVSYFTFGWDNSSASNLGSRRVHLYSVLPSWSFIEGDLANFATGKLDLYFPVKSILREDNWRGIVFDILNGLPGTTEIPIAVSNCEYLGSELLADHAKGRVEEQVGIGREILENRPNVVQDSYEQAVEIASYLSERNIRVVFFTPPYSDLYTREYEQLSPESIQLLKAMMNQLQKEYHVEYYDYSTDEAFVHNNRLFKDADHLNECGARLFSRTFLQTVDQQAQLP